MTIQEVIQFATDNGVDVLDAELLLANVLEIQQSFILAHEEAELTEPQEKSIKELLAQRSRHVPLAYLVGTKEFFNLPIQVNEQVLVPRPESEEAIEWILKKAKSQVVDSILDVGTGSGALACALAKNLPQSTVTAIDTKEKILDVARGNAKNLGLTNIEFKKSNLLEGLDEEQKLDVIIANLPYLNPEWQRDPSTQHEPAAALYAEENGLGLYKKLLGTLRGHLKENSFGIFEADPRNASELQEITKKALPHSKVELKEDGASLPRFVTFEKS